MKCVRVCVSLTLNVYLCNSNGCSYLYLLPFNGASTFVFSSIFNVIYVREHFKWVRLYILFKNSDSQSGPVFGCLEQKKRVDGPEFD